MVTDADLTWPDGLSALQWANSVLRRVGGYARSSAVPASIRGTGMPWSDRADLALTITGLAASVQPGQASVVLRSACQNPGDDPGVTDLAADALIARLAGECPKLAELPETQRREFVLVALSRLSHETARPHARRRPPRSWYNLAARVNRKALYRKGWRTTIMRLEEQGRTWRDMGARQLEQMLEEIGRIDGAKSA